MEDDERDLGLGRALDESVRDLRPAPGPRLAEIRRTSTRQYALRWTVPAAALALLLAGLGWALADLTGGGHTALPSPGGPSASTATSPRCALATTSADFDGDGAPDVATLSVHARAEQSCRQAQYAPAGRRASFRLQLQFGSGARWAHRFRYCTVGQCGETVFTGTDLNADGRADLAADVGPGASVDRVEFFRIGGNGLAPLRIAPSSKLPAVDLRPGPAILGGGFDSGVQSPVSCQQQRDGTPALVATHAVPNGGPWRITRVRFELSGDTLHAVRITHTTVPDFAISGPSFDVSCS